MALRSVLPAFMSLLFVATFAKADWSAASRINQINIGGNGVHGTFVSLVDFSFSGCMNNAVGILEAGNVNYKEMIAVLLAAKMADRGVKLMYSGCSAGYPVIKEVSLQ